MIEVGSFPADNVESFGFAFHGKISAAGNIQLDNGGSLAFFAPTQPNIRYQAFDGLPAAPARTAADIAAGLEFKTDAVLPMGRYTASLILPVSACHLYRCADGTVWKLELSIAQSPFTVTVIARPLRVVEATSGGAATIAPVTVASFSPPSVTFGRYEIVSSPKGSEFAIAVYAVGSSPVVPFLSDAREYDPFGVGSTAMTFSRLYRITLSGGDDTTPPAAVVIDTGETLNATIPIGVLPDRTFHFESMSQDDITKPNPNNWWSFGPLVVSGTTSEALTAAERLAKFLMAAYDSAGALHVYRAMPEVFTDYDVRYYNYAEEVDQVVETGAYEVEEKKTREAIVYRDGLILFRVPFYEVIAQALTFWVDPVLGKQSASVVTYRYGKEGVDFLTGSTTDSAYYSGGTWAKNRGTLKKSSNLGGTLYFTDPAGGHSRLRLFSEWTGVIDLSAEASTPTTFSQNWAAINPRTGLYTTVLGESWV